MRYFQHMTNARHDDFVRELMYKFGSDGYLAWFGTIEMLAEALTPKRLRSCGKNVETLLKASPRFFSEQLLIDVEKLKKIYTHIDARKKGRFRILDGGEGDWIVNIPKVLEFSDEWAQRVLKESREELPSDSGETRASRAEQKQNREEQLAGLRKGMGGAGAGGLGLLAEEFARITGRSGFHKVRNPQYLIDQLKPLIQKRGFEACAQLMRERIDHCMKKDGKPPSSLKYFIPVFSDDSLFKNGVPPPAAAAAAAAAPPRRTDVPRDLGSMTKGLIEGMQK